MSGELYRVLDGLGIAYTVTEHEAVFTVEEAHRCYGHLEGGHTKNLFLRNKKGDRHYLVVAESTRTVDLKALRGLLEESALSFASPQRLLTHLGLTPGSVSPFGLIHDEARHVIVVLDAQLMNHAVLNFHPNVNTATLSLASADFRRFLEHLGHELRLAVLDASIRPVSNLP